MIIEERDGTVTRQVLDILTDMPGKTLETVEVSDLPGWNADLRLSDIREIDEPEEDEFVSRFVDLMGERSRELLREMSRT